METILIYVEQNGVRMYLTEDGTLSGRREDAAHHWAQQFPHIVAEQPGFLAGAQMELA